MRNEERMNGKNDFAFTLLHTLDVCVANMK